VQGAMESPHRGRSYLEKSRRVEGRVSKFLFQTVRISGTRFILRGGWFVTPCFSKRIEFYKFIYLNKYLFVVFHADACFPLYCEVFQYFITRVGVIKIQICFELKLVCKL
jgi:hypothetical protein